MDIILFPSYIHFCPHLGEYQNSKTVTWRGFIDALSKTGELKWIFKQFHEAQTWWPHISFFGDCMNDTWPADSLTESHEMIVNKPQFQSNLWASVSEPTDSVPSTQPQKREVGTITLWPHARVWQLWFLTIVRLQIVIHTVMNGRREQSDKSLKSWYNEKKQERWRGLFWQWSKISWNCWLFFMWEPWTMK